MHRVTNADAKRLHRLMQQLQAPDDVVDWERLEAAPPAEWDQCVFETWNDTYAVPRVLFELNVTLWSVLQRQAAVEKFVTMVGLVPLLGRTRKAERYWNVLCAWWCTETTGPAFDPGPDFDVPFALVKPNPVALFTMMREATPEAIKPTLERPYDRELTRQEFDWLVRETLATRFPLGLTPTVDALFDDPDHARHRARVQLVRFLSLEWRLRLGGLSWLLKERVLVGNWLRQGCECKAR